MGDLVRSSRRIMAAYGRGKADRIPIASPISWSPLGDVDKDRPGGWRGRPEFAKVARLVQEHCDPVAPPCNTVRYPNVFGGISYWRFLQAPGEFIETRPPEQLSASRWRRTTVLHTPKGDLFWSRLAAGDLVATPPDGGATLALAGGRLRVALAPGSLVRIMDPRGGTALQLVRGEAYCRGTGGESTPMVASPLANVAAGPGVVSLHVTPEPAAPGAAPGTMVTLAAHDGAARVIVHGQGTGAMPLRSGQVLTLSSERGRGTSQPIPIGRLRQALEAERRAVMTRHGDLELRWEALMAGMPEGVLGARAQLARRAGELQEALGQTRTLHARLEHNLKLLDRCQAEGQRAFRLILRPVPRQP